MKPVKKKMRHNDFTSNDDLIKKPVKKQLNKRNRKLSIYDPMDDEESVDLEFFDYDLDAIDQNEDDDDY
ncbi:MAG: hypothetical protein CVT92_03380 [Bacteroidetes bacterium HGW-Bacteroidetes-1]|jgi:hypothetical protein|nr:MAG: hypothetical protein CVT92_03380 [Bacteroidetes bacterium HGW-Bacteroidetes-1]